MKFSIVMITYNCAKQLEKLLNSIKDLSDDILIVDSSSTDCTFDICKKYNTRVIHHVFKGFSQQKNFAVDNAKYDWILTIDSDEIPSLELIKSLKTIESANFDAFECKRRNIFSYNNATEYYENTNWQTILFNRQKTRFKNLKVHEVLDLNNCKAGTVDGYLNHYTVNSRFEHLRKIVHYAELSAEDRCKKNKRKNKLVAGIKASFAFLRTYLFRKAFLYGKGGLFVAKCSYINRWLKYTR